MDRILIGENIKRMRLQKGVTQEQLAEAVGVSAVAVSKWERNETMPDISLLPGLAYFFQVSIDELMSYDAAKVQREIRVFRNTRRQQSVTIRRSVWRCRKPLTRSIQMTMKLWNSTCGM